MADELKTVNPKTPESSGVFLYNLMLSKKN